MWSATKGKRSALASLGMGVLALFLSTSVFAGASEPVSESVSESAGEPAREAATEPGFWGRTSERLGNVVQEGNWDLYLSGFSYHARDTYTEERIKKLNEKAWGIGFGKSFRNARGNDDSLYLMVIKDSHYNAQWMAGYAHQWMFPMADSSIETGAGITALLIRRKDWFDGNPFPAMLPFASIGTQNAKLYATYVPRISTKKGKGDVLLFFAKFQF